MKRFFRFLLDVRVLSAIGLAALITFLLLGADALQLALIWAVLALGVLLLGWGLAWAVQRARARRAAQRLEADLDAQALAAAQAAPARSRADIEAVRQRMNEAVRTIKRSRLGQAKGRAALYELPWYVMIGNPAAGKSTAIVKSGLKFPFADNSRAIIEGIGGTRHCDWFFTSEGILLDTAGRYSVHEEDRPEWLGFLDLLKKHRPMAPINGILLGVSLPELAGARPEAAIQLAKNLRQRVQELIERLEVFAPVYVMFTKSDLISGFVEFFEDRDPSEREKVWGATLPYAPGAGEDAVSLFDRHFDELREGLKELALARMSLQRGQALPTGVLTFPLEFAALQPALRAFIATLFEDNPFQFKPVFRGFYFTSAVQEGAASSRASEAVADQFALLNRAEHTTGLVRAEYGFFLKDLFSRVVFADRDLVRQFASRGKLRLRAVVFALATVALAAALAGWVWSYLGNRQLVANVQADLDKVVKLQADRVDLASRLQAADVLQDRIEQLAAWRDDRPLAVSLGLYQGEAIERRLREAYFQGVKQLMLAPVSQALEGYLDEVNKNAAALQPMARPPTSGAAPLAAGAEGEAAPGAVAPATLAAQPAHAPRSRYVEASPTHAGEAYNALKTYLMLAEKPRMESAHLSDQVTRYWRGWLDDNRGTLPREQMIRSAERMISFSMANLHDPAFPTIDSKLGLVDQTRENLRRVVRGMPARDRVYAEIKARASTRFAPMTVARILTEGATDTRLSREAPSVVGSYAIAGTFTRQAWYEYVQDAIKEAAGAELQRSDWVLNVTARDDLSLEGSPDQIRKELTELYKTEYVREWQRFVQGIAVAEFASFDDAVAHLNKLGDEKSSPIRLVLTTLFDETSWDNPSLLNARLAKTQKSVTEWIKQSFMRLAPSRVEMKVDVAGGDRSLPLGPIGREFEALTRVMVEGADRTRLLEGYFQALGKVRSRFNRIRNEGDPGPGLRKLMAETLESGNSELADALKFVDEKMLTGMSAASRAALRPLLVRPLMQAYAVAVRPAETEINRIWEAQVHGPFQRTLAAKYPFDTGSKVEAGAQEIAKIFGPSGAVAAFSNDALGPLVLRRGGTAIEPRSWADIGIRLRPAFAEGYAHWVAALDGAAGGGGGSTAGAPGGGGAAGPAQTAFQILPQGSPGLAEYTLDIDSQVLRYRNTVPAWSDFIWPNPVGTPGARITAVTNDGRTVLLFQEAGSFGLDRLFAAAAVKPVGNGVNELTWSNGKESVSVHLRLVRTPGAVAPSRQGGGTAAPPPTGSATLRGLRLPALVVGVDEPVAPAGVRPAGRPAASGATP